MTLEDRRAVYEQPSQYQQDRERRKRARLAETHRHDEEAEDLLRLRESDPAAFEQLASGAVRLRLAHYEDGRAAHRQIHGEAA